MSPTERDVLLCATARQHHMLDDAALLAVLERWRAGPPRPLLEVLTAHIAGEPAHIARLHGALQQHAAGAQLASESALARSLPLGIQRLLASEPPEGRSDVVLATEGPYDTRAKDSQHAAPTAAAQRGGVQGERFDVQQVHAQGGLGVVYLARDHEIDRTVALKQIKPQWADDEGSRARFLLEARVTGRLEHPGIVPIYALGADAAGRPFYAMRLIRGESLLEAIHRFHGSRGAGTAASERLLELRKLLQRFLDVCNAVEYAHSKGVIHRDLKPANIMVGKFGETLVVDWGLAKVIGSDEDAALTTRMLPAEGGDGAATRLGSAVGTPSYMSPEQAGGRNHDLGPAADVYSLGATLYHLLAGSPPHAHDDDVGVMIAKVGHARILPPREHARWLPRPLESICMKALAPSPAGRYASAGALSDDIERWLGDEPVRAHAEHFGDRVFRWMRRHQTLATSLAVAYLVAAVAIVVGIIGWNSLESRRPDSDPRSPATRGRE